MIDADGKQFAASEDYRFTVTLTGLKPGTRYVYRVGRDEAWSKPLFSTSGDPDDFTFLYLGDVQEGYAQWGSMIGEVYRRTRRSCLPCWAVI